MLTYEQKQLRRIGGSDSATIMGKNPYKTRYRLWQEKTGQIEPENIDTKQAVIWGNISESFIRSEYERQTGITVSLHDGESHTDYPFITGNFDGTFIENGKRGVLEIKNIGRRTANLWDNGVPEHYLCQVYHYMFFGYDFADVAVLICGNEFRIFRIEKPSNEYYEKMLEDYQYFWDCVETLTPPAIIDEREPGEKYPIDNGLTIIADDNISSKVAIFKNLKKQSNEIETQIKNIRFEIEMFFCDNQILLDRSGKKLLTWKTQTTERFSISDLKEDDFETYNKYLVKSSSRVLR